MQIKQLSESLPWTTEKLRFRPVVQDDNLLFAKLNNDPDVRRYIGRILNVTEEETRKSIISGAVDTFFVVERKKDCSAIGYTGFVNNPDIGEGDFDLLCSLLPSVCNKGLGDEILKQLVYVWFKVLGRDYCTASVFPAHKKAIHLLEKNDFRVVKKYTDLLGQEHFVYKRDSQSSE